MVGRLALSRLREQTVHQVADHASQRFSSDHLHVGGVSHSPRQHMTLAVHQHAHCFGAAAVQTYDRSYHSTFSFIRFSKEIEINAAAMILIASPGRKGNTHRADSVCSEAGVLITQAK